MNKKILFFDDTLDVGGVEKLIIEWTTILNKDGYLCEILTLDDHGKTYQYESTLKKNGCKIYKLKGVWLNTPIDFIKYEKQLKNFFQEHHDYKVVHLNSSSKNYFVLKYAKKYGIPIRIAHAHNIDFQTSSNIKKTIGKTWNKRILKYATNYLACSKEAGLWMFGKKIVNSNKFKIIHNGIEYEKFKFDKIKRNKIRDELNINNEAFVVGCVARLEKQKNYFFTIDIFNEIQKIKSNSILLIIGQGTLEKEIKNKIAQLGLDNKVILTGFKENVNDYLNAMDIFLMPSLFEGLGMTLIEAQANGLPCYTSKDVVPVEAKVSNQLYYLPLSQNAKAWENFILTQENKRKNNTNFIKEKGYLIEDTVKELRKIYEESI